MITNQKTSTAAAAANGGTTYDGYLYRNNLDSLGSVPAAAPYNLCPDIIRTSEPTPDPQGAFTTVASLDTLYDCAPDVGQPNYYYLRTLNGGTDGSTVPLSLYAVPAQLIVSPETWTALDTASGEPAVPASAASGHYAVGNEPFVWTAPAVPAGRFYTFVAQAGSSAPTVSSWHDLAQLITQQPEYGIQTVALVSGAQSWERAIGLTIPAAFSAATLNLTITSAGFEGCRLGIIASSFTSSGKPVILNPVTLTTGEVTGIQFPGDPGYDATLYVQCWIGDTPLAAGSTISLELTCVVSDAMFEEAAQRNLLDSRLSNRVARSLNMQVAPTPVMPVGAATFLVGAS